jgi:hypothetical protein
MELLSLQSNVNKKRNEASVYYANGMGADISSLPIE